MNPTRSRQGGTLALVAVAILIIGLVGIGLFFLSRLIGGHRELDYATRSGNLNVAKQAIANPVEVLSSNDEKANFEALIDQENGGVNLRVYNRLVGQALLVAMNAKADGGAEGTANARKLIRLLQSQNGVGGRLRNKLGTQSTTNDFFSMLGLRNSTKMLGGGNMATAVYQTSWVEGRPEDIGATNLLIPAANQLPVSRSTGAVEDLPASFKRTLTQADGKQHTYLRGYQGLDLVGIPLVGVPVQPGSQPHLVSQAEFTAGLNKFSSGDMFVPPNAFEFGSQKQDQFTDKTAGATSRAVVGALNAEYKASIPRGYIMVANPAGIAPATDTYPKSFGVLDDELDPAHGGITVDNATGAFSTDAGLINDWRAHNADVTIDHSSCASKADQHPPTNNLFDSSGNPISLNQAHSINPFGSSTPCTDRNTVNGNFNEGVSPCTEMLDQFENAYSPPNERFEKVQGGTKPLTAVENAKADVIDKFRSCGYLSLSGSSGGSPNTTTTGFRKYICNPGTQCVWTPLVNPNKGQISRDGTIGELIAQATGNVQAAEDFLRRRIYQIKPEADQAEIQAVLSKPVPLSNQPYYIYMDQNSKQIKFDTQAPAGRTAAPTQTADGTPWNNMARTFQAQNSFVNPKHEAFIHDQLYQCPQGGITVRDEVRFTPSSGWNNMLGEIRFQETVTNNQAYYCCPD